MNKTTYHRLDPSNPVERACTHPWEYRYQPFRIYGNLYYVGNSRVSSHLLDTGDGLILIDTAFAATVYLLLESVRQLGFDPQDIRYILHTHCHYDHIQGTRAIAELTGCKTCVPEKEVDMLDETSGKNLGGTPFHESFTPDLLLKDGDTLSLGDTAIHVISTPGHSPDNQSFYFEVQDPGGAKNAMLPGGLGLTPLKMLAQHGLPRSLQEEYLASLEKLRDYEVDIILGAHPHHNDMFPLRERMLADPHGPNPFLQTGQWHSFLDGQADQYHQTFPQTISQM